MRQAQVPEDMTSDMKNILGIISTRQLIYLIVGGSVLYIYIPIVFGLADAIVASIIMCMVAAIPTAIIIGLLGFYKHPK
ncbi:PrgI family mobile element protein, partial [Piscibacillus sp. B03]|uniref:PrgI family mobile element protein n=1 Tax=Piscibacillus sp. B03 TaxID=3457430 RepID=UPI003FCD9919